MISIVGADGVIRVRLPDETLLVFLSDTHIGGSSGSDIFESAAELTMLLEDLHHHQGPVELVLAGDFLDVLRMEDVGGNDPVASTLARPEYRQLFATLRAFAEAEGHRVVLRLPAGRPSRPGRVDRRAHLLPVLRPAAPLAPGDPGPVVTRARA
jgi:hypothetical protein